MKKIIYFTAGSNATGQENVDIATLNALAAAPYQVNVSRADVPSGLGSIEACDFVAGTIPSAYSAKAVFDVSEPPRPDNMQSTQGVVSDGQELDVDGGKITFAVSDGVVTATYEAEV